MQPFSTKPGHAFRQDKVYKVILSANNQNQINSLRSITTILLLTSFLVLQYARQVSYWECRLSNYFKTENQKCDCEKLIKLNASQEEPFPVPAVHNHSHLDESFYPSRIIATEGMYNTETLSWSFPGHSFIERIIPGRLDRPPNRS